MATSLPCPNCAGEVRTRTFTWYVVCAYCRHILEKRDDRYTASGVVSEIAEDMSPFQIGSEGWFDGVHFGLIGRLRLAWEHGFWNEWYAYFDDGRFGWLAEAQGMLAILFESTDVQVNRRVQAELREYESLSSLLGQEFRIESVSLVVSDVKKTECIVVEGETPRMSVLRSSYTAIDFMGNNGEIATVEFVEHPPARRVFVGRYVAFTELRVSNLRELEGWSRR